MCTHPSHQESLTVAVLDQGAGIGELGIDSGKACRVVLRAVDAGAAALPSLVDATRVVARLEKRHVVPAIHCPGPRGQRIDGICHQVLAHAVAPRVPRAPAHGRFGRKAIPSRREVGRSLPARGGDHAKDEGGFGDHRRREGGAAYKLIESVFHLE